MGNFRLRLLPLLLGLLAVIGWWLGSMRDSNREADEMMEPDQTVEVLRATTMNALGRPYRRLVSPLARHYPNNKGTELDKPILSFFPETGEPPWIVRSDRGWVSEKTDRIRLHGAVFIDREADVDSPPVHVRTREVLVKPDENYARTSYPLRATRGEDWLHSAHGGEFWFGDYLRLHFHGRVRLEFRPNAKPDQDRDKLEPDPGTDLSYQFP